MKDEIQLEIEKEKTKRVRRYDELASKLGALIAVTLGLLVTLILLLRNL